MKKLRLAEVRQVEKSFNWHSRQNFSAIFLLGGGAVFPFVLLRWQAGDGVGSALTAALVLSFWALAAWSLSGRRIGIVPVLVMLVLCDLMTHITVMRLYQNGIFWIYPLMMAVAYVMPWRWSIPLNMLNVIITVWHAAGWMSEDEFSRLAATLLVTWVFLSFFAFNLEQQHGILRNLVVHDPLTGAFNRRYFERKLDEARRQWMRTGNPYSMMMIDIDHFKLVNDIHGHAMGDKVLVALVAYLNAQLRPQDRLFRVGGEEFALLLPETSAAQAVQLAECILKTLAAASLARGLPRFTVSAGVAELPARSPLSEWQTRCDAALYAAKGSGRNRVVAAEPEDAVNGVSNEAGHLL
ncbi:MAG: putative diguanylate cyclase YdaM [Betaproteobacteria bacterium ADurb.Bin341]|nr:MAG: putative diguanylate cyclase YdaM [Betaproteobacteria bacterium ADurb.Bin341]